MAQGKRDKEISIAHVNSNFEREPLVRPFGFKGGYMSEIWQTISLLKSEAGNSGLGLDTQNVLWSDAKVFAGNSEAAGNALMYAITERAMQMVKGMKFTTPIELQEAILEDVYSYAQKVTSNSDLRMTFALNALVGLDKTTYHNVTDNPISSFLLYLQFDQSVRQENTIANRDVFDDVGIVDRNRRGILS